MDRNGLAVFNKKRTDLEWKEYYADVLGAALLMPKPTIDLLVKFAFKEYGIKEPIILGENHYYDYIAKNILPKEMAKIFKVSKKAISIRLKKLNYIIDNRQFKQLSL